MRRLQARADTRFDRRASGGPRRILGAEAFRAVLRHECARAERYGAALSLVIVEVGDNGARATAAKVAQTLLERTRVTDAVGWLDESSVAGVLCGTNLESARKLTASVIRLLGEHEAPQFLLYSYPDSWLTGGYEQGMRELREGRG